MNLNDARRSPEYFQEMLELKDQEIARLNKQLDRLRIASVEFINDWRKGDFQLPQLARYDAQAIETALEQLTKT